MKGFPIVDGLKVQIAGETVTIEHGELFLPTHKEQVFHVLLKQSGQDELYKDVLRLKYDGLGNVLPIEFQDIEVADLESHEAVALGVFDQWEAIQAVRSPEKQDVGELGKSGPSLSDTVEELVVHKKDVLIAFAAEVGATIDPSMTKAQIAEAILNKPE